MTAPSSTTALRTVEQELFDADRPETTDQRAGAAPRPNDEPTPWSSSPAERRHTGRRPQARAAGDDPRRLRDLRRTVCELADGTVLAPSDVAALLDAAVIERAVFDGPDRERRRHALAEPGARV